MNLRALDFACCAVAVVATLGSVAAGLNLLSADRHKIEAEQALRQQRVQELGRARSVLEPLTSALEATHAASGDLNSRIPERGTLGSFLGELDQRVHARGVTLLHLQPLPAVESLPYVRVPVQLQLRGAFHDIYGLLHELESMSRIMEFGEMSLSRAPAEGVCYLDITISLLERP
jgi:Tfp pilus assembly protein PilO